MRGVLHGGHRGGAGEGGSFPVALGEAKVPPMVCRSLMARPSWSAGEGEGKLVPGLQQDALGPHEALAHRPVGGLAEVAPSVCLGVGPAGHEGDLQVRKGAR